ncbi:hypothetical protein [Pseudomonas fulva]|uniref:hypothetical protein n=1 Tax=Pseudomonas fulva TaxID=47880 RepID=UPI00384D06BE
MSQVSIPCVAHFPSTDKPSYLDPALLTDAIQIPPDLYCDDDHHRSIYCPGCGVMCSRNPRRKSTRKDNVHAFYSHIPGFTNISCPYRKASNITSSDSSSRAAKPFNLVTFSKWKILDNEAVIETQGEQNLNYKSIAQGRFGNRRGVKLAPYEDERSPISGTFHTVRRLVTLAKQSIDIYVQFPKHEPIRLGDLILSIQKVQNDSDAYIGKMYIFFGQPTSIARGTKYVFLNFTTLSHELSGYCTTSVFENLGWKLSATNHYYYFYGLLEGNTLKSSVRILEPGQIHRTLSLPQNL